MSLFSRKNKDEDKKAEEELKNLEEGEIAREELEKGMSGQGSSVFSGVGGTRTHKILKGFYVSEKSSTANSFNQYVFKVFDNANKSEIKKEVSKLFNVRVKDVKIQRMPEKRRDFGRHPGMKSGFKKAVVVLKEGHTIGQAKP